MLDANSIEDILLCSENMEMNKTVSEFKTFLYRKAKKKVYNKRYSGRGAMKQTRIVCRTP